MDTRELRFFTHLAGSLHFGRTSRACNITPSTLTRTIQRLEEEIGEQLFIRDNRSVSLTTAGELFRNYAEDVILRREQLRIQLAREQKLGGTISLYCSVTAAYSILPDIFQQFRTAYPQVHIKLMTGDAARALTHLQNREVDVTIAALPKKVPQRVAFLKIMETPLVFIGPTNYEDTVRYSNNEIDWQQTPIIMPDIGLSRQRIDRWFAGKKITPDIYAKVAGNEAIIAMVSLGCGVGVVPLLVLEKSPLKKQVTTLDISPQLTPFSIAICTMKKKARSPQVQAFWEMVSRKSAEIH
jgi:LysR family positive regulator for ilvC